jgi:chorismate mutase
MQENKYAFFVPKKIVQVFLAITLQTFALQSASLVGGTLGGQYLHTQSVVVELENQYVHLQGSVKVCVRVCRYSRR